MIGDRALRLEDPVLVRGTGVFVGDKTQAGELHMRVVRSPVAHGRIVSVEATRARRLDGIVAAWTSDDVDSLPPIGFRLTASDDLLPYRQPVLARGTVRYVGEPIAVVFATSAYLAEDAAELVDVDIEPLPAHLDSTLDPVPWLDIGERSWAAGLDHPGPDDSEAIAFTEEYGDVDTAFATFDPSTHVVVESNVRIGRHTSVPLECRGLTAVFDKADAQLVVEGAGKVPYWNRDAIAQMIGLPPSRVVLREAHVGGSFGARGELYPEDVLVAVAALRLRAPIKWIEDRQEHLVATNHSRDQHHQTRALVRRTDGWIEALDATFTLDQGAYVRTHGATVASLTASMLPGPYVIPSYRVRAHVRLTHKTPAGTYRSPGRYEGTFARERLIDRIAATLGLEPAAVRRANFIPADEMPYERPLQAMGTDLVHDSGDYALLLDKLSDRFDFAGITADVTRRRASGEAVGFGTACFVEKSGLGPFEGARVAVDASGEITVTCGASSVGQGVDTVLAQIVAEHLQVGHDTVRVVRGQTDRFEFGRGAFATRLSVMAGSATALAAEALVEKAKRVAASELRVSVEELEVRDGAVSVIAEPGRRLTLGELARLLEPMNAGRLKEDPGLSADGWFRTEHMTYPYGVHAAVVSIDRPTGKVTVERLIVGYDVGRALNPMLVEGQIAGGAAQGIGGALYEEFRYADDGTPLCTTFMDYLLPTAHEVPDVEMLITEDAPSPINPLGVKGAGEGGTTAVGAAIASAVDDALGIPGAITALPIRPELLRRFLTIEASEDTPEGDNE